MKIKIVNNSNNPLPEYATEQSAGLDLRANLTADVTLQPLERRLIPIGLRIALPKGYEAQVRPRSGLALKHGITLLNTPGTIDADYRGEIGVIMVNLSNEPFKITHGDRIAQLVIARFEHADWDIVESLDETSRGEGGFGHTGKEWPQRYMAIASNAICVSHTNQHHFISYKTLFIFKKQKA